MGFTLIVLIVGLGGVVARGTGEPSVRDSAAPPESSAPSTTIDAEGDPAIEISGYVVAAGASCADPAIATAGFGDGLLDCWVVANTGDVTFELHTVQFAAFLVADPPDGDANAPTELVASLAPGDSRTWSSDAPTSFDRTGTARFSMFWDAIETTDFTGSRATATGSVDVEIVRETSTAPPLTLPATA